MYIHTEKAHNTRAAEKVVPLICELFKPESVLDVGCGIGTWLHVFQQNGVTDVVGVDGDYVDRGLLEKHIDSKYFVARDLSKPFHLQRRFDIAISFEVAEHLPPESAEGFAASIAEHADIVIFSAAIPHQVGQNHLNEQWQSYWAAKFKNLGYDAYDLIRPKIWHQADVDMWYKQNILVYSKKALPFPKAEMVDLIHPDFWELKNRNLHSYDSMLSRIRNGKAGIGFHSKTLFRSVLRAGKKS